MVWDNSSLDSFFCPYHGWKWGLDGILEDCPDRDDYPQGDQLEIKLKEVRVDTWAGLVGIQWTMRPRSLEILEPSVELYKNLQFEKTVRVNWWRTALGATGNFGLIILMSLSYSHSSSASSADH